jgi:hypothetical protein
MIAAILWDMSACITHVNRRFGGKYHLHVRGRKSAEQETSLQLVPRQKRPPVAISFTQDVFNLGYAYSREHMKKS